MTNSNIKVQDYVDKLIESREVDIKEEKEVRDPLSGAIIGYIRNYVLNSDFKPEEEEKEVEAFFREWVRKSREEILNYVYMNYREYFGYPNKKFG